MSRPKQRRGQADTGGTQPNVGQAAEKSKAAAVGENGPRPKERSLTRAERQVLTVILNPEYSKLPDTQRCAIAGVSRRRWVEIMGDPWFREQQQAAFAAWLERDLAPIWRAHMETAAAPGKDGFRDRELAFKMIGYYKEERRIEHKKAPAEAGADPSKALEARLTQLAARVTQQEERAASPPAPPPAQQREADETVGVRPN